MKKYWGILGATLVALTLAGCGNNNQTKSSDTKPKTHKVVKASKHTTKKVTKSAKTTNTVSSSLSGKNYFSNETSGIFFKGSQFIWKEVTSNGNSDVKETVYQGSYKYDAKANTASLSVENQSKTYIGAPSDLDTFKYSEVQQSSIDSPVKVTVNGNSLTVNGMTLQENDNSSWDYDSIVNKYGVQSLASSMQKKAAGISSAKEFQDFMVKCFQDEGNDTSDLMIMTEANNGRDYDIYDGNDYSDDSKPIKTIKAKYTMDVNNPHGASEMYLLGDDNNVYWSMEQQNHYILEDTFNKQYHQAYGN